MISKQKQDQFIALVKSRLTPKELEWITNKTAIISFAKTNHKFKVFFSLAVRFIDNTLITWSDKELENLETIYPGFGKTQWTKQDLTRTMLMIAIDTSANIPILKSFFEIAEMKEQIALYKGLYLLENASEFSDQVAEGIRTNMVNVFDAIASGNPFAQTYLKEYAWNQLILKSFFMDRKLYNIQYIDQGKNKPLANMLQDYVKERWAAGREASLEIWRMVDGYLRDDIIDLFHKKTFKGIEKDVITKLLRQNNTSIPIAFWDSIGKNN